jgi:hypothetical protein
MDTNPPFHDPERLSNCPYFAWKRFFWKYPLFIIVKNSPISGRLKTSYNVPYVNKSVLDTTYIIKSYGKNTEIYK